MIISRAAVGPVADSKDAGPSRREFSFVRKFSYLRIQKNFSSGGSTRLFSELLRRRNLPAFAPASPLLLAVPQTEPYALISATLCLHPTSYR